MVAFVLLILAVALLITNYKNFFPNRNDQSRHFGNLTYFQQKELNYLQEEQFVYTKADSKEKGDDFEKFVISLFDFQSKRFVLKEWRSDKYIDGIYPESNYYPDFEIVLRTKNYDSAFAVECKYRSNWKQDNTIYWAKHSQVENYAYYSKQKNIPVIIVLGVGGIPKDPDEVYIFSLESVNFRSSIQYDYLQRFRRENTNSKLFYDVLHNILK